MRRLGCDDATAVSKKEYETLLWLLAQMFFPATINFSFDFLPLTKKYKHTYGNCAYHGGLLAEVKLHRTKVKTLTGQVPQEYEGVLNAASMSRLGTLLHEVCHAFLQCYTCKNCRQRDHNQLGGHGFAWQRIACWAMYAASHSLRLKLELSRFLAIQVN
ncbi:hypothetical protein C7974DRAFT_387036 [Boeremia exigua]|uniref:uncharacterized protein n=1 Tax=Boeremia exigua TaxID=749465 RepID=UPI001E8E51E6|nr:uncharacterized protein C7974DRAFT_387036 [Boeremia exigua]KAH6643210.1 hypothetical protein C7974DRAFT_387036 [Boeremia exigua]